MSESKIYQKEVKITSKNQPIITFSDLLDDKKNIGLTHYRDLPFDNSENLRYKFFKKVKINVQTESDSAEPVRIYLQNTYDTTEHFDMTQEIYDLNKDILDTLDIVIFIRVPYTDCETSDPEYDDYNPSKDQRLQHLLEYVEFLRNQ